MQVSRFVAVLVITIDSVSIELKIYLGFLLWSGTIQSKFLAMNLYSVSSLLYPIQFGAVNMG